MRRTPHLALPLALGLLLRALGTAPVAAQSPGVTIGQTDSVWSAVLKERRKILVYTPSSYADSSYLPQRYPVLYLLDGDAHFHSVTGLLHILSSGINGTFVLPEMIVVAIPNTDRTRDLTPTRVETDPQGKPQPFLKTSGGMGKFFEFLRTELFPHVERSYRTAPYRVLVGHSLGGITAINALYTIPDAFNGYVAIDPSLWYDDRLLLKQARDHVSRPGLAGRALFVGQANTISPDDTAASNVHFSSIVQFNSVLETYNRSGLRYAYRYYADDDHGSVPLISEYDALRFIFAGYKTDIAQAMRRPAYLAEHFAGVSDRLGYRVLPPERMFDLLGRFQMSQDTAKAIELLESYAAIYPESPRAHEALGGAWLVSGDTARAVARYERALVLRPNSPQATDMLRKLRGGARR